MVKTGIRFRDLSVWWLVVVLAMACGITGCAATRTGEVRERTIWQLREQNVKIEKQDHPAGVTVSANSHPVDIPVNRVRDMLGSIEVRLSDEKTVPLFGDDELTNLSQNIHAGLASAAPDEDVTFAIIGHYPVLMGLMKERMVTTGRVFCRDGAFEIIFGDLLRTVRENEDRRLYPFLPGSRGATVSRDWVLIPKPGGETFVRKRPDWIAFSLAVQPAPEAVSPPPESTGSEQKATPAVSPAKPAALGKKSAEERLMLLNELHNKKLITDEEYRAKRLEILNEL